MEPSDVHVHESALDICGQIKPSCVILLGKTAFGETKSLLKIPGLLKQTGVWIVVKLLSTPLRKPIT